MLTMTKKMLDYEILFRFYHRFLPDGFQDINPDDALVKELEEKLEHAGQFIHIADLIDIKVLYCSSGCSKFYGVSTEEVSPITYFKAIDPEELQRYQLARSRLFKLASEMYLQESGKYIMSSNFRTRNANDEFVGMLYQVWMEYTDHPVKTVYQIQINTDISGMADLRHGYHFYFGEDRFYFRFPDETLLRTGNVFSKREFEIIKAIAEGLESHEIAEKLFLSIHTVNTHRRNILLKTGKRNTHQLILDLQERGIL